MNFSLTCPCQKLKKKVYWNLKLPWSSPMIILFLENCKNYSIVHVIFILSLFSSILRYLACDLSYLLRNSFFNVITVNCTVLRELFLLFGNDFHYSGIKKLLESKFDFQNEDWHFLTVALFTMPVIILISIKILRVKCTTVGLSRLQFSGLCWKCISLSREIFLPELAHLQKNPLSPNPNYLWPWFMRVRRQRKIDHQPRCKKIFTWISF